MGSNTKRSIALILISVFVLLQPASVFATSADEAPAPDTSAAVADAASSRTETTTALPETEPAKTAPTLGISIPAVATATSKTPDTMTINWSPVEGALQYNIYRFDTEKNDFVCVATADANSEAPKEFIDSGLLEDTEYTYRVTARVKLSKTVREDKEFEDVSATTVHIAAPEGVNAVSETPYCITVSWEPVEGATQYNIYRYEQEAAAQSKTALSTLNMSELQTQGSDDEAYELAGTVFADAEEPTKYEDTELSFGIRYFYKVTAVKEDPEAVEAAEATEEAAEEAEVSEETAEAPAEEPVEDAAATEEPAAATEEPAEEPAADEQPAEEPEETEETEEPEEAEPEDDGLFESVMSEKASAKVIGIATPAEITAEKYGSNSIILSWKPVSDALYYNIYSFNNYLNDYSYVASAANYEAEQIVFLCAGLASGTRYDYEVTAVGTDSEIAFESARSESVFAETEEAAYVAPQPAPAPAKTEPAPEPAKETEQASSEQPAQETETTEAEQPAQETEQPAPVEQAAPTQVVYAGSQQGNAEMIWALGKTLGMTDAQCAGILGNMMAESGLDQTIIEGIFNEPFTIGARKGPLFYGNSLTPAMQSYTQSLFGIYASRGLGINHYAYQISDGRYCPGLGLIQFTGPLGEALLNYANAMGRNWYDLDLQMAMIIGGSDGTRSRYLQFLNDTANGETVYGATGAWFGIMEMGAGRPLFAGPGWETRIYYAQYWYNILSPNSAAITANYSGFAASVIAMAGL